MSILKKQFGKFLLWNMICFNEIMAIPSEWGPIAF